MTLTVTEGTPAGADDDGLGTQTCFPRLRRRGEWWGSVCYVDGLVDSRSEVRWGVSEGLELPFSQRYEGLRNIDPSSVPLVGSYP